MPKYILPFLLIVILSIGCSNINSVNSNYSQITQKDSLVLSQKLLNIYESDQKYRRLVASTIEKYGVNSLQIQDLSEKINSVDSINLLRVKSIIKRYGWIDAKTFGDKANAALFLVIQHAPLEERLHFLPIMKAAAEKGTILKKDLALLEDRNLLDQGKKQIYGTQLGFDNNTKRYYAFPIENEKKVDERRAEIGLSSMASYLSQWNIK